MRSVGEVRVRETERVCVSKHPSPSLSPEGERSMRG